MHDEAANKGRECENLKFKKKENFMKINFNGL